MNKGEAAARNTGVRAARGKYIAFLDSDDEWLPGKLKSQIELMQSSSEDIGGCCTGQYLVDSDGREELIKDWSDNFEITGKNLLVRGCGIGMGTSFLVRRSVYETVGYYDESLPLLVDLDWLCRYAVSYKFANIKEPYIRYYKAPIRPAEPMEVAVELFEKKNEKYLSGFNFISRMAIKSRFFCYLSICYHEHGPWSKYIKSQLAQFLYNPRQSFNQYLYFGAVLIGLRRIGNRDQQ